MEVKNLKLEGDTLSGEFHCEYSAGIQVAISEGVQVPVQTTLNDEGFAPFVVYVHPDKPSCNLNFLVFAPAGTSLWVPGGLVSHPHSVDLKKLRKPKRKSTAKKVDTPVQEDPPLDGE